MARRSKVPGKAVTPASAPGAEQLAGAWRLVSWETRYVDGSVTRPFGRRPRGLLLYTPDGAMSASIAARDRRSLSTANPREAPIEERARAFDTFLAYAGRYSVRGTTIRHDVAVSTSPSMSGSRQVREARLARGRLELSAVEGAGQAGERRHVLVWSRTSARRPRKVGKSVRTPKA